MPLITFAPARARRGCHILHLLLFCWCSTCVLSYADNLTVHHYPFNNTQEQYMQGLLELALSYSSQDIRFSENTHHSYSNLSQSELIRNVDSNEVSVMWSGTSKELETALLPIRIPLYKGLLGHRLLLINRGNDSTFRKINDLGSLASITLGQGEGWPDTFILKTAQLDVVTSKSYLALFDMLAARQFHAFPRGLHEPWAEIKQHNNKDLDVEKDLLLVYKLPTYFFVSRKKPELAKEIKMGLERAIAELTFNDYFFYSKQILEALERAQAIGRVIIEIDNPYLPEETPLERPELWLDLADLI